MSKPEVKLLLLPECRRGYGSGHIRRCLALARGHDGVFVIPPDQEARLCAAFPELAEWPRVPEAAECPDLESRVALIDRFTIEVDLVRQVAKALRIVGLDARGPGAQLVPWVADILPRLRKGHRTSLANTTLPGLLLAPDIPRRPPRAPGLGALRILLSFGGEDAAGLGRKLAASGLLARVAPGARVDLLHGSLDKSRLEVLPPGWQELKPLPQLDRQLHQYDLLVTSFGFTAFEARQARLPQIHLNPSSYHQALSLQEGFDVLGLKKPDSKGIRTLKGLLTRILEGTWSSEAPAATPEGGLSDSHLPAIGNFSAGVTDLEGLLAGLLAGTRHGCPGCGQGLGRVIHRSPVRSFCACPECGLWYQILGCSQPIQYNGAYFQEEYRAQYGKTYVEDFSHIKAMGQKRLDIIRQDCGIPRGRLLDIGCAYGPFLQAAWERGYQVEGCDISPEAVAYVTTTLGLGARVLDFMDPQAGLQPESWDVVSLWYVIEHFPDLTRVLPRLNQLLVAGGILAMATPSAQGISARQDRARFLDRSPMDHHSLWRPKDIRRLLKRYGFRLVRIRSTGHHPERFGPWVKGPLMFRLVLAFSRWWSLGDTFELYARKI